MAVITTIQCGVVLSMIQSQAYALPAVRALLFSEDAASTFQQSNTDQFTVNAPLALSAAGVAEVNGGFIRLTSGGPKNVILRKS